MKKILLLILITFQLKSQNILHAGLDWAPQDSIQSEEIYKFQTTACGTPYLSTGYPAWTNYWAGWMVRIINTNVCPITIKKFEARFQGTSGYRIYTKTGTFVGFETTPAAWILVGSLATLTGTSTTAPTDVPIAVNVIIPAGGSQSFYLTRSDNVIANRHLYIAGTGIAGTTIYASNVDLSITEGSYVDPYFAFLNAGTRRPSFDVCYTINCILPIELTEFKGKNLGEYNKIEWTTISEANNDYFTLERSVDGFNWMVVDITKGAGNSFNKLNYVFEDYTYTKHTINYYRLKQTDHNGETKYSDRMLLVDNTILKEIFPIKLINVLGQEVDQNYKGIIFEYYNDGSVIKKLKN